MQAIQKVDSSRSPHVLSIGPEHGEKAKRRNIEGEDFPQNFSVTMRLRSHRGEQKLAVVVRREQRHAATQYGHDREDSGNDAAKHACGGPPNECAVLRKYAL